MRESQAADDEAGLDFTPLDDDPHEPRQVTAAVLFLVRAGADPAGLLGGRFRNLTGWCCAPSLWPRSFPAWERPPPKSACW